MEAKPEAEYRMQHQQVLSNSSTPIHHLQSRDSSFQLLRTRFDSTSSQNASLSDSGMDDSPYLHYRFDQAGIQYSNQCILTKRVRTALATHTGHFMPSPAEQHSSTESSCTCSQWTPDSKPSLTRKQQICKTYKELFPDSGVSDMSVIVRSSSPIPGGHHSPCSTRFLLKDFTNCSPFTASSSQQPDSISPSPSSRTSPPPYFGASFDMYFTSSSTVESSSSSNNIGHFSPISISCSPPRAVSRCKTDTDPSRNVTDDRSISDKSPSHCTTTTTPVNNIIGCRKRGVDRTTRSQLDRVSSSNCSNSRRDGDRSQREESEDPDDVIDIVREDQRHMSGGADDNQLLHAAKRSERKRRPVECDEKEMPHDEHDLIGDFSKLHCLKLTSSKHNDLKSVLPQTLHDLIAGRYSDTVASYAIVDCRYPYEYNGGHILGAKNVYTKDQLVADFFGSNTHSQNVNSGGRFVIVFHCEFSSERAPKLMRFMRNHDREVHADSYPNLKYPELYLLDGGYQAYHQQFGSSCIPPYSYTPMYQPEHLNDLKHVRGQLKAASMAGKKQRKLPPGRNILLAS